MNLLKQNNHSLLYRTTTLLLYCTVYLLIALNLRETLNPLLGLSLIILAVMFDSLLAKQRIRSSIRLAAVLAGYFTVRLLIVLLSELASGSETYNFFDKLPYLFLRDSLIAVIIMVIYFAGDSVRVIRLNQILYYITTLSIIGFIFYLLRNLNLDSDINKTLFKNYMNYSLFLITVMTLLILRHIGFTLDLNGKKADKRIFILLLILVIPLIGFLFSVTLRSHVSSNKSNYNLFNSSIFNFDFSNFVKLADEIKVGDNKVLILEVNKLEDEEKVKLLNNQIYLKRFSLEEFKSGIFQSSEIFSDPYSPPVYLSGYSWEMKNKPRYKNRAGILETLYLINIDSSSLMGSDLLYKIVPVTNWDNSSYKQIYKSFCDIPNLDYMDLMSEKLTQNEFLKNIHPERKKILLNWGNEKENENIRKLAEKITVNYSDPFYKSLVIEDYLKSNYYYSFRPGLAKDGDQLGHFLFGEAKKGYCTYFAFAMVTMLRSIGIVSRVAVGFAPDMRNSTLNFIEIRAMDAHAWVEVYFDSYGWIQFDPTSQNIAPGEEIEFAQGNKDERDKYIEEILKNKDKMRDILKQKNERNRMFDQFQYQLKNSIRWVGILLFLALLLILIGAAFYRKIINRFLYLISRDRKKKIVYLYKDILGSLSDCGIRIGNRESLQEFALRVNKEYGIPIIDLTSNYQKTVFSSENCQLSAFEMNQFRKEVFLAIKKLPFKSRLFAIINLSRLWKRLIPLVLLILIPIAPGNTEESRFNYNSLNQYLDESDKAIQGNFFDKALDLLNEAEKKFPLSHEPGIRKGDLYMDNDLYESAILEYKKVLKKKYKSERLLDSLATAYGKIGEDREALTIYEEAHLLYPYSKVVYDNLGWMYFKVHETQKGIDLVKKGIKKFGPSSDLLMTLGTLYSDIWDYEQARNYYYQSIESSYTEYKSNSFRSIAYYNLSILENAFLYYENSFNTSQAANSLRERSSAHMQLNYLYQGGLEFKKAYEECLRATQLEPKTLFPEMSMAGIYITSGNLDQGIRQIHSLINNKDFTWMLYFGTTKDEYYADLYKNLSRAYQYKSNRIQFTEKEYPFNFAVIWGKQIYYKILSYYNAFKFANLQIKTGEQLIKGGSYIEGLHNLFDSYEKIWPAKAYKILQLARNIELKINPRKKHILDYQDYTLKNKVSLFADREEIKSGIMKSISLFDSRWEKDFQVDACLEWFQLEKKQEKKVGINDRILTLYPPALPLNGSKTLLQIKISNFERPSRLLSYLKKRGIVHDPRSGVLLEIEKMDDKSYFIALSDEEDVYISKDISIGNSSNLFEDLSLKIFDAIFIIDLK